MKTVLVTGATRGLGLAIATRLLSDGYRVIASGRTQTPAVEALAASHGDRFAFRPLDLGDIEAIHGFVTDAIKHHGPLYGLVNNAGIGADGVLATMHNSDIQRVMTVNAVAPIVLAKYVVRPMLRAREGRIVNISSVVARTGYSGLAAYAASKAAIEGFTRSLARELGRANITVNAVAPGYMATDMTQGLVGEQLEQIQRRSALKRLAEPGDVAGAVSYFLGPDGANLTGSVLVVDAGGTA